jgi:ABC-type polysaccharide/polyol phosphate transport system ATPase subunit
VTEVAIRLRGVSKKYRIFDSPRQRLKEALDPLGRTYHRDFWALKDIDLVVPKGQTVGIVGRNGSGKSTLLQIVTSVLQPTAGTVEVAGRVAALLELGAGFDPDFTGRQNVRQYGRLQGLKFAEIEARLPEVEAFADIGEFFDRPVKSYSSGMFARLAFAAAINVDPDVLILDEILAVGDATFQQRCYERIRSFRESGKTILLVSHSLETILDNCDSAFLLEKGSVVAAGQPKAVVDRYRELIFDELVHQLAPLHSKQSDQPMRTELDPCALGNAPRVVLAMMDEPENEDRFPLRPGYNPQETLWGNGDGMILDYCIDVDNAKSATDAFVAGTTIRMYVLTSSQSWHNELHFGLALRRTDGLFIYGSNSAMRPERFQRWNRNTRIVFSFGLRLAIQSGHYFFDLGTFRVVNGETVRLRTRRNCVHIVTHHTPEFDGVTDLSI